ncbi:MAG: RNA polymerase sigma-70 factor (ECF subfamily), partial [Flavobacteriales bacterium]
KRRRPETSFDEIGQTDGPRGHHHDSPLLVEHATPASDATSSELGAEIQRAVDELEEKYRVVFLLRDVEELSIQETAEILDLSITAVKSRLHRARLALRASLERYVSG